MDTSPALHIVIVYTEAGGGHRASAEALRERLLREPGVRVTLLSLYREFAADLEWSPRLFGRPAEDVYNHCMLGTRWGRLLWPSFAALMALNVRMVRGRAAARLSAHWQDCRPDLVVSVMPLVNALLAHSVATSARPVPFATVMTDFVEAAPGAWIVGGAQWLACGTLDSARQARRRGVSPARLLASDGMVVRSQFTPSREGPAHTAAAARRRLGLDPQQPTAIVLLGGHGSPALIDIALALGALGTRLQAVFLCGRNEPLVRQLDALPTPYAKCVRGYVDDVADHLAAGDFLIGKPGAGVVSEALTMGLPMVLEFNAWTLAQERHNARWAVRAGVALPVRRFQDVAAAAQRLLSPAAPERQRAAAYRGGNRAGERVAAWLLGLARGAPAAAPAVSSDRAGPAGSDPAARAAPSDPAVELARPGSSSQERESPAVFPRTFR